MVMVAYQIVGKHKEYLYVVDWLSIWKQLIQLSKCTNVDMFGGYLNLQLGGDILKIHYPKLNVMRGVERNVYLLFNDVSKIPILNQIIISLKAIYIFYLEYIISHILYFNQNHIDFILEILACSVVMIPKWLDI